VLFAEVIGDSLVYYNFRGSRALRPAMIRFHPDSIRWIREGKKTTTYSRHRKEGTYEIVNGPLLSPKRLGIFIEITPYKKCSFREVKADNFGTEGPFNNSEEFDFWCTQSGLSRIPARGWIHGLEKIKFK